jgi:DNA polymerase epsilon subunit 2
MGNFSSRYPSSSASGSVNDTISGYFDELASIIGKFPHIAKEGRFVIIPGPNDPGLGAILPRPPIPSVFTTSLRNKVKHVHFASNPCRVRYFSKEFVLGKLDVLTKLRRNTILNPSQMMEEKDPEGNDTVDEGSQNVKPKSQVQTIIQHGVKTMLDQGHMCPVPAPECPIYWQYDHVMRLYPPPDALVIGDACTEQYYENYGECDVMNPGPFGKNYGFLVYRPFGQIVNEIVVSDVEFSQID